MSKQKTMTFEEFDAKRRGVGRSRARTSMFTPLFDSLRELVPTPVTIGSDDLLTRRSALTAAVQTYFGTTKRVRTMIDGDTLYVCLMPDAENSK